MGTLYGAYICLMSGVAERLLSSTASLERACAFRSCSRIKAMFGPPFFARNNERLSCLQVFVGFLSDRLLPVVPVTNCRNY